MLRDLLAGYTTQPGRFDELLDAHGRPRPHWEPFLRALAERASASDIGETLSLMEREIHENGITYNVYADPQGMDRPWAVDPLPLLISPDEWREIEAEEVRAALDAAKRFADVLLPKME